MQNKNRWLFSLFVFVVVTIIWYFVLDARTQVSGGFCALVDCLQPSERTWPLLYGSTCCGSTTIFREFAYQLLQLLAPGVILALIVGFMTRKK